MHSKLARCSTLWFLCETTPSAIFFWTLFSGPELNEGIGAEFFMKKFWWEKGNSQFLEIDKIECMQDKNNFTAC